MLKSNVWKFAAQVSWKKIKKISKKDTMRDLIQVLTLD